MEGRKIGKEKFVGAKKSMISEHDYEAGWSLSVKDFGQMCSDIKRVEHMR